MKKKTFSGRHLIMKALPVLALVAIQFYAFSGKNSNDDQKSKFNPSLLLQENAKKEVEPQPEFPGGQDALIKFIIDNVKYPEAAKKDGIGGKVYVSFVVTKKGKVTKIKVVNKGNELLDKEAIRVISAMPDWIPGKDKGVTVDVEMTLPIAFKLN